MMNTQNRMAPRTIRKPGPTSLAEESKPKEKTWEAPQEIEAGKPCTCGAPRSNLLVYGHAKTESDGLVRRYVRCCKCGKRHTITTSKIQ